MSVTIKRWVGLIAVMIVSLSAGADMSSPSRLSVMGSVTIAQGSELALRSGHDWVLQSVVNAVDGSVVVLRRSTDSSRIVLRGSQQLAATTAFAVGEAVQISTHQLGVLLIHAGEILAFIPNEIGRSLVHHSAY